MVKAKPYVSLFLRALKEAATVDTVVEGMLNGLLGNAPIEIVIQRLNDYEGSMKIMVDKIVEYYNKYKEEGRI